MKARRRIARLAVLLLSASVGLLCAEQAYRFHLFGSASFSIARMKSVRAVGVSGILVRASDPELVVELAPNLDVYHKLAAVRTNSRGLHDREIEEPKPAGTYRVAVVGDSFTMAEGVELEDTYHQVIEARLNARHGGARAYEFINFGVPGYSLRHYEAVIRKKALRYDPDLILVGFCTRNDHRPPRAKVFETPFEPKPVRHHLFKSYLADRVRAALREPMPAARPWRSFPAGQGRYMGEYFSRMAAIGEERGIPVVVASLSSRHVGDYADQLEEIVRGSGLRFVDATAPFQGVDGRDFRIYLLDEHPNAAAHALFADRVLEFLDAEALLSHSSETRPR